MHTTLLLVQKRKKRKLERKPKRFANKKESAKTAQRGRKHISFYEKNISKKKLFLRHLCVRQPVGSWSLSMGQKQSGREGRGSIHNEGACMWVLIVWKLIDDEGSLIHANIE